MYSRPLTPPSKPPGTRRFKSMLKYVLTDTGLSLMAALFFLITLWLLYFGEMYLHILRMICEYLTTSLLVVHLPPAFLTAFLYS